MDHELLRKALQRVIADCSDGCATEWEDQSENQYWHGLRRGLAMALRATSDPAYCANLADHGLEAE